VHDENVDKPIMSPLTSITENENETSIIDLINSIPIIENNVAKSADHPVHTPILINADALKNTKKLDKDVDKSDSEPRIHENWLSSYIKYTNFNESPTNFHLWTGISTIAAALNRNVYIKRGYGKLFPNLFIVLVSPTGKSKKTSAANIGVNQFLQKVDGIRISRDETTPKGLVQFLSMAKPTRSGTIITHNCTGYIYAPELSDLLGEQSYNLGLIKKLTSLWDSPDVYHDTTKELLVKNHTPTILTNVCLNMFGCSNPEWLAHGLKEDSFGGGFMGRTLFIFSTEKRRSDASAWMEIPEDIEMTSLTLLKDLQKISQLRGAFTITNDAYVYYKKLYREYDGDFTGRMAGYLERKLTFALKLAMVLSVNFDDDLIITKQHIEASMRYLDEIEKGMPNAFVYINATNEAKIAQHIIDSVKESGGSAQRNILVGKFRHLVRNIREFDDIMQTLIEARIIKQIQKDGQHSYIFMTLWEKMQKEAAMEMKMKTKMEKESQIQNGEIK
jgi:hypothetical protein